MIIYSKNRKTNVRKTPKNNRKSLIWDLLGVDFESLQQVLTGPDQVWTDSHRFSSKSDRIVCYLFIFWFFPIYGFTGMLGPRDHENPMRETTAYRAISISSHMVGIPGHCETERILKLENCWNSTFAALAPDSNISE